MNLRLKKNGFHIILAQCYKFVWKVANILDFFTYLSPFQIVKEVTLPTKLVDQINENTFKKLKNLQKTVPLHIKCSLFYSLTPRSIFVAKQNKTEKNHILNLKDIVWSLLTFYINNVYFIFFLRHICNK